MSSNSRGATPARHVQREAEQHGEQQHLQDVALGERIDDARRNDVQQEIGHALHRAGRRVLRHRARIERGDVDVHAGAGLHHVDDDEARR